MIRLFVSNTELELGEEFSCPITRQFEDIENPTNIKNDFSKTVTIPHTQKNDQLFGHIYSPDRLTVANQKNEALKGIYFDPYKKINFRLEWNDSVVMTGYLKVLSVTDKGYECTLNGELGKIFQEMQKITFDESKYEGEEKEKYWIDSSEYVNTKINKELVYESWNSDGQTDLVLRKVDDPDYKITDIIGFAPNNAFNKDFDYSVTQTKPREQKSFSDILKAKTDPTFAEKTGANPSDVLNDGITPRGIGEFRSNLQLPFVYFNKLWQIFQNKVETTTGYKFNLDEGWFNENNQDWSRVVTMLLNRDELVQQMKTYNMALTSGEKEQTVQICNNRTFINTTTPIVLNINYDSINDKIYENDYFKPVIEQVETINADSFTASLEVQLDVEAQCSLAVDWGIIFRINAVDLSGKIIKSVGSVGYYNGRGSDAFQNTMRQCDSISTTAFNGKVLNLVGEPFIFTIKDIDQNFRLGVTVEWVQGPLAEFAPISAIISGTAQQAYYPVNLNKIRLGAATDTLQDSTFRSGDPFTLGNLWSNDYSIFDVILNYCKRYRIGIIADYVNKTIQFTPLVDYFKKYKLLNWDDKIDKSRDYKITPITFESRYVLFDYAEGKTELETNYKSKFGYNIGEKRLETAYSFDTNTSKLFNSKVTPSNVYSDTVLSWVPIYDKLRLYYVFPAEIYVDNRNDSGDIVSCFGEFYYWREKALFDPDEDMREVVISDDTSYMVASNKYSYGGSSVDVTTYPLLDIGMDGRLCIFDKPSEHYTYENKRYDNSKGIYDLFWEKYIAERYNTQNKLVTCYLKLTPSDFINFEFNKFIQIDNQLYMVNKIYDYDITNDEPTKVDLITIQDIKGYTTNNLQ